MFTSFINSFVLFIVIFIKMLRFLVFVISVVCVSSLHLRDAEEGVCQGPFQPVNATNENLAGLALSMKYISGGSRYKFYLIASGHPNFRQMQHNDVVFNMCLRHNGTDDQDRGAEFGFGNRVIATYRFAPRMGEDAVFDITIAPTTNTEGVTMQSSPTTLTYTDYKTFMILSNCYVVNNVVQKNWEVLSVTPNLSLSTKFLIENHAVSLGFARKNFVFLNYDNCGGADTRSGIRQGQSDRSRVPSGGFQWKPWRNRNEEKRGFYPFSPQFGWFNRY